MRTLIPFLEKMDADVIQGPIVADAGYGSESKNLSKINSECLITLFQYNTMLKEETKRWRSDERKVMNWHYNAEDDYYIDPKRMFVLTLNAMHIAVIHMVINEILKYMKLKNSMKIVKKIQMH